MTKFINFEDTLFILNVRIKMLRDLTSLDADPDIFLLKTMDDLDFINTTLSHLLEYLKKHDKFIERQEQFFNLSETEDQFYNILEELKNGGGSISATLFPVIREKLESMLQYSKTRKKEIDDPLLSANQVLVDATVVSSEELNELLKDF